jgi:hypothetical protein
LPTDDNGGDEAAQHRRKSIADIDEGGFGKSEVLPKRAIVGGRRCKSHNWKNLEKRPASAGLFIVFGDGRGGIAGFVVPPGLSRWPGKGTAGADDQNDYLCPCSILHRGGAGRSWAINNTSNVSGVE